MARESLVSLTDLAECGGCAAKLGPSELAEIIRRFSTQAVQGGPLSLAGLDPPDDALVYALDKDRAIVQTVDFFPPIVNDPYAYGAIAAANAVSDVYAMGGDVLWALNIVAFPDDMPLDTLAEVLRGGADKIVEAGGFIGGGHSIRDRVPKYGMCVTGMVSRASIWRKSGARAGDLLFVTKAIGTGLILTAARGGRVDDNDLQEAIVNMMRLNRDASQCLREFRPSAVTDVTGFGLLGHGFEIAHQSSVRLEIEASRVPLLAGASACARAGVRTSAHPKIRAYLGSQVEFAATVDGTMQNLLLDPQTSGGLLVAISEDQAGALVAQFDRSNLPIWRIGRAVCGTGMSVILGHAG